MIPSEIWREGDGDAYISSNIARYDCLLITQVRATAKVHLIREL